MAEFYNHITSNPYIKIKQHIHSTCFPASVDGAATGSTGFSASADAAATCSTPFSASLVGASTGSTGFLGPRQHGDASVGQNSVFFPVLETV
ncbi:hypothetical protein Hanom_Chr07g00667421 [Helianthus anomalus]